MKSSPLLIVIAVGGLFGWFASDLSGPSAPGETPAGAEAPRGTEVRPIESVAVAQNAAGEIVLPRAGDGHFYAEVTVDGVSSRMLVDTGASVLALTGEDAEAMGITWEPDEVRPVARGASGAVFGVPVTLGQVQLGDFDARGVEAVVVPDGLAISLLGQSFLSQIEQVRIESEQMILGG